MPLGILDNTGPNVRQDRIAQKIGRAGLHALFPNEFEFYAILFELVDSQGATIDFLTFPVSPEKISYDDTKLVNIKKSLGGISAIDTETFTPKTITMSGTFGRKFKLLISKPTTSESASDKSVSAGVFDKIGLEGKGTSIISGIFDQGFKTGYGTIKVLEAIINKSSGLDIDNQPVKLYMYNPTLGHNWLVKVNKFTMSQDRDSSNRMWRYDIILTAIAPVAGLVEQAKEKLSDLNIKKVLKKGDKADKQLRKQQKAMDRRSRAIRKQQKKGVNPSFRKASELI